MNRQLWTISNVLSVLRIILVVPLTMVIIADSPASRWYALALIIAVVLTDFLDGFFARTLNQTTETGKIIDPLADKIAAGAVSGALAMRGEVSWWFVVAVLVRDLLILAGGMYIKKHKGILLQSTMLGKWTVGVIAMYIFSVVLEIPAITPMTNILLVVSIAMVFLSFAAYVQRFVRTLRLPETGDSQGI